jgi:hypothetical protein
MKCLRFGFTIIAIACIFTACGDDEETPVPEITSITPSSALPNTIVAITGRAFSSVFSENKVMFNGKEALVFNSSNTQLNVVVPTDAQTGPVSVTINGRTAVNQPLFTVIPMRAEVASMSPASGGYNTLVTITGSNFLPAAASNTITFNGKPGVVESASGTNITVRVPVRAGSGPVIVNGVAAGDFNYQPDVYIIGNLSDNTGYARATYWKNGSPTTLSTTGMHTYAYDMALVGGDIYVTGMRNLGAQTEARYWKNGTEIPLSNAPSSAHDIFAVGSDVYIAGYQIPAGKKTVAMYWKNGTPVITTDGGSYATATSIVVHGEDIYLGGHSTVSNGNIVATYWKNNLVHTLSDKVTFAHGIFVTGSDVYLTGSERNTGPGVGFVTYWKNGTPVYLSPGLGSGAGVDIVVAGHDVYVAGVEDNAQGITVAKYWKNGNPIVLTDGSRPAYAAAIDVIGNDVYVVGHEYNSANRAVIKLWKNGVPTAITDGGYFASAEGLLLQ